MKQKTTTIRAIGLMSGTSMDGIDVACLQSDGVINIIEQGGAFYAYDPLFQRALKAAESIVKQCEGDWQKAQRCFLEGVKNYFEQTFLENGASWLMQAQEYLQTVIQKFSKQATLNGFFLADEFSLKQVIDVSTLLHVAAVQDFCESANLSLQDVELIGYHGQTLYHQPSQGLTIQAGDGALMAALLKTTVIYDFRQKDVKYGGQGAPLAPLYHHALLLRDACPLPAVVINCGGIANVTLIPDASPFNLLGFDTGPGNVLLDRWVRQKTQGAMLMDKNGEFGLKGRVDETVLASLYADSCWQGGSNYYWQAPPKSLDTHDFTWPLPALEGLSLEDGCATLAAFTAKTIVDSLKDFNVSDIQRWILAGGGWHNQALVSYLQQEVKFYAPNSKIFQAAEQGLDGDLLEAQLFAYLAIRSIKQLPTSIPTITGARDATVGGVRVEKS